MRIFPIYPLSFLLLSVFFSASLAFCESQLNPGKVDLNSLAKSDEHDDRIQAILRRLESDDDKICIQASYELWKEAKLSDLPALVRSLKIGGKVMKQVVICEVMGKFGDVRAGDALRYEIKYGNLESKRAAVRALGELKSDWAVPILVRVLRHEKDDLELRMLAATALGKIASRQAFLGLLGKARSTGVRNAMAWALKIAKGEVDEKRIDTEMPSGPELAMFFKGTFYHFYHPTRKVFIRFKGDKIKPRLLVCVHGKSLNVRKLFKSCLSLGRKHNTAVLVPLFDIDAFPNYDTFNIKGKRSDKRLIELVEHVAEHADLSIRELFLYGEGAGGDFVQRFVMTYPDMVGRAAFEAKSPTSLDGDRFYPEGLAVNPFAKDVVIDRFRFVKSDVAVLFSRGTTASFMAHKLLEEANSYASSNGISSRFCGRIYSGDRWAVVDQYLFGTYQ